jgi:Saxitoxin biosynthesis operon protein SxtJ
MHQINAHSSVSIGSERSFGFVFAAVFTAVAAWPLLRGQDPRWTAFGLACVLAVIALRRPALLKPLNHGWFKFALGLSRITTPIVMGLLFFAVVVPTGLIMRLCRKDLMCLHFDHDAPSCWVDRDPPGPPRDSMRNQF